MVSLWMGIYDDMSKDRLGSQHNIPYKVGSEPIVLHGVLGPQKLNARKIHGYSWGNFTPPLNGVTWAPKLITSILAHLVDIQTPETRAKHPKFTEANRKLLANPP